MNFSNCNEKELWEYVASKLSSLGIRNVLVGGAVAAIYSEGAYKSGDLDIVLDSYRLDTKVLDRGMRSIGFIKEGRHWIHPECEHIFIEFCNPPVSIGSDFKIVPLEVISGGVKIHILSPTDCIKDRLASYIHWSARECLDQSILVANESEIDLEEVKRWCLNEHSDGKRYYDEFFQKISQMK